MDSGVYETDLILSQYLLFHYGHPREQLPWPEGPVAALGFPQRCVREGISRETLPGTERALDIGCAVGRSSFELGRLFQEVMGIDYSQAFISAAQEIAERGALDFSFQETGLIRSRGTARRPAGVTGSVSFEQGDAQDLRADLGNFDGVLAANLLCRLSRPADFLNRLPALVRPGGQLIITTPNTWLEEFTAREFWLGATPQTGEPLEAIRAHLEPAFSLEVTWDMPLLIREHRRKYQWSVAQASRWIRKA
jgi:putative 4-mercaptohistidine N1-methyltranferase